MVNLKDYIEDILQGVSVDDSDVVDLKCIEVIKNGWSDHFIFTFEYKIRVKRKWRLKLNQSLIWIDVNKKLDLYGIDVKYNVIVKVIDL